MYSEILKGDFKRIFGRTILKKYVIKFSLTFGNNLRKTGFENFEEICMYSEIEVMYICSEILRKFQ